MLHLVAAVAHADGHRLRGPNHLARALVVEDVERVLLRQHRLVHERPTELGLALGEEGLHEVLLHVQVLLTFAFGKRARQARARQLDQLPLLFVGQDHRQPVRMSGPRHSRRRPR